MCNYCQGDEAILWTDEQNNVFVDSNGEVMATAKDHILRFKVRFCPMCGRRFNSNYLDLTSGDNIYYADFETGIVEHGTIETVTFNDGVVDSFSVTFDDGSFDVFDGSGLGKHYFTNKQEAQNILTRGEQT